MKTITCLAAIFALSCAMPQRDALNVKSVPGIQIQSDQDLAQNSNAQYQFSSNIEDHINDQSQHREEVREGLAVKGMYSYADGYFRRTVQYEADENGYRVVGEEIVPLEGPKIDLAGTASVDSTAHGTRLNYIVQSVPADGPVSKVIDRQLIV